MTECKECGHPAGHNASCPTAIEHRDVITRELYGALFISRVLREEGFTRQSARKLGLEDHYAVHGVQGLVRWLKVATDCALHNAELNGVKRLGDSETAEEKP